MNAYKTWWMASVIVLAGTAACAKKSPEPEIASAPVRAPTTAAVAQDAAAKTDAGAMRQLAENLRRVHFLFDSDELTQDSKDALTANAKILATHPNLAIEVQGHCDDRGTTEYNLTLGQRRAEAVQRYLVRYGVAQSQVKTVSFGEERPLVTDGRGDHVWAQNRRAEFRLTKAVDIAIRGTVD
ncbi:OmpA family protein [Myxococcota bacterium]|nr:OmpA family protein [Myxococcota bacterium]